MVPFANKMDVIPEEQSMVKATTNHPRRSRAMITGILIATILCTYVCFSFDTSSSTQLRSVVNGRDRPLEERDSSGFHRMLTAEVNDSFSAEQMKRVSMLSLRSFSHHMCYLIASHTTPPHIHHYRLCS